MHRDDMESIYQEHAQTVYGFLLLQTHDSQLAEELTQETFYQALRSIGRFDGKCKISTWLCAIAKNVLLKYWQKEKKQKENLSEAVFKIAIDNTDEVLGEEKMLALFRRLHTLPDNMREVIYLRLAADLSFRQIGEIMGQSETWARVNYYRGKEKLLEEEERWEN